MLVAISLGLMLGGVAVMVVGGRMDRPDGEPSVGRAVAMTGAGVAIVGFVLLVQAVGVMGNG